MASDFIFTSESVSEGHPDKIADQISDAVLDSILCQQPEARVACETLIKSNIVLVAGETSTAVQFNVENIVRRVLTDIGYSKESLGFDMEHLTIINAISKQSPEIIEGIECPENPLEQGAGDQGLMFGFAIDETPTLMPAAVHYSHKLMERQALLRKNKTLPWLYPDAKSQVTLRYTNGKPTSVDTITISTQHSPEVSQKTIKEAVIEEIILPVMPREWMSESPRYFVNPTGKFVAGGPRSDCGLTGRKIIVDTYGGAAHHGGGAFSGKDPSKVDRSAAYMCRYIAKNIVASQLACKCEVQVSYAIGVSTPISIMINTFGTGRLPNSIIREYIYEHFDFRPYAIIKELDLLRPIYQKTASYGHFGREDNDFTWEKLNKQLVFRQL